MSRKLRSRSGESLTEVMLAILIVGVSIAIMGGLISAAARLNAKARTDEAQLYAALSSAELADTELADDVSLSVTVTPEGGAGAEVVFPGARLCGVQDKLYAYYWEKGG